MERYTKLTPEGYTAEGHSTEELLAALGKYEDLYESVAAELELVRLNLQELSKAGKARSDLYDADRLALHAGGDAEAPGRARLRRGRPVERPETPA
ncbi:MAG: hypothetical protein U0M53_11370, partial [Oscillospiraceae bacterium]|nr:hypothetical protein [Oscillospiraceae bacterium]